MSISHDRFETILDEAIQQQGDIWNPELRGMGKYDQDISEEAIDGLDSRLPSPLKIDESGYTIEGSTIKLHANFNESGKYKIDTRRTGAAEYHGIEFDVSSVELNGTIELSGDPREMDDVEVIGTNIEYTVRAKIDAY